MQTRVKWPHGQTLRSTINKKKARVFLPLLFCLGGRQITAPTFEISVDKRKKKQYNVSIKNMRCAGKGAEGVIYGKKNIDRHHRRLRCGAGIADAAGGCSGRCDGRRMALAG